MSNAFIFNDVTVLSAAQKAALPMPFTAEILGATLQLNSAPAGSAATFDIEVAGVSILAAALSVAAGAVVPTTAASFQKNGTITGAVAGTVSGTATYTVATGHLFKVGDLVTVASVTVSAGSAVPYNFTDKQVSAVTSTTVTVTGIVGTPGTYNSGGTIVCTASPVVVPAGAVLSFDCDSVGSSTAGTGYTLAIRYAEAADSTSKAPGGLDASRF
jgi:hypothetical protein